MEPGQQCSCDCRHVDGKYRAAGSSDDFRFLEGFGGWLLAGSLACHTDTSQPLTAVSEHAGMANQGGGLHAPSSYEQEAGSSVLFEHCSAGRTLAAEAVDEYREQIALGVRSLGCMGH